MTKFFRPTLLETPALKQTKVPIRAGLFPFQATMSTRRKSQRTPGCGQQAVFTPVKPADKPCFTLRTPPVVEEQKSTWTGSRNWPRPVSLKGRWRKSGRSQRNLQWWRKQRWWKSKGEERKKHDERDLWNHHQATQSHDSPKPNPTEP